MEAVRQQCPLLVYVDGRSGRGKTLLMKMIVAAVRAQGEIVLCSATTGLAALNYEGGTTAHATYKIPVTDSEDTPNCNVTARSQRAELLRAATLHIWGEFPMAHRHLFEAVSRCLCDINGNETPCGGKVFVCCGDFRQIPPVIPGGGRSTIVEASIRSSPLWTEFTLRNLTHPQRDASDTGYSHFIDLVGDGDVDATHSVDRDTHLTKMEPMSATTSEEEAIQFVFPDVNNTFECSDRAIITGTNVQLNGKILARLDGPVMILHSVTRLDRQHHGQLEHVLTEEFLHSLKSPGVPNHNLKLKLNCLCLVMRNISVQDRVMNNTKVILREVGWKYVTVETLSDNVPVHLAKERSDSGTETISTPLVLCDHGEQVSRPDTSKDLLRRERASVCSRTTVRWNEPCQEPTRHLDADAAESSARWNSSHKESGLPRASTIFSSRTTSSPA